MKCPGCNFVCSELRDICPRCLVDLRAQKRLLGLPVMKPDATYAELRGKAPTSKSTSGSGFLLGLVTGISEKLFGPPRSQKPHVEQVASVVVVPVTTDVPPPAADVAQPILSANKPEELFPPTAKPEPRISQWFDANGATNSTKSALSNLNSDEQSLDVSSETLIETIPQKIVEEIEPIPVVDDISDDLSDVTALLMVTDALNEGKELPECEIVERNSVSHEIEEIDLQNAILDLDEAKLTDPKDLEASKLQEEIEDAHLEELVAQALEEALRKLDPKPATKSEDLDLIFDFVSDDESPAPESEATEKSAQSQVTDTMGSDLSISFDKGLDSTPESSTDSTSSDFASISHLSEEFSAQDSSASSQVQEFAEVTIASNLADVDRAVCSNDVASGSSNMAQSSEKFSAVQGVEDDIFESAFDGVDVVELSADDVPSYELPDHEEGDERIVDIFAEFPRSEQINPEDTDKANEDVCANFTTELHSISSQAVLESVSTDDTPLYAVAGLTPGSQADESHETDLLETQLPLVRTVTPELPQGDAESYRAPTTIFLIDFAIPVPNYAMGAAYLWLNEKPTEKGQDQTLDVRDTAPNISTGSAAEETPEESSEVATEVFDVEESQEYSTSLKQTTIEGQSEFPSLRLANPADRDEVMQSFSDARSSMTASSDMQEIDLQSANVFSEKDRQRILLLFSLAHESFELGADSVEYVEEVSTSEGRLIENAALVEQLGKIEKHIDQAATQGLLKGRAADAGELSIELENPTTYTPPPLFENATIVRRLAAFSIDGIIVAALTISIALYFERDDALTSLTSNLLSPSELSPSNYALICLSIACIPIALISHAIASILMSTTLGTWIVRLRILTTSGHKPAVSNMMVRSFLVPISSVFLGWLPIVWGKAPLHDRLARTRLGTMNRRG